MFATILVSTLACTQMESPGNPFSPVQIAEEKPEMDSDSINVSEKNDLEDKKEEVDPLFEPAGSVLLVSEVNEQPKVDEPEDATSEEQAEEDPSKNEAGEVQAKQENPDPESIADAEEKNEQKVNTEQKEAASLSQWPLRVVKTEVDLSPPRAILGLPSGEEVVIRPGMQLPSENLVVMSIGSKAVVLARIHTDGDHARVEHLTLTSLND